MTNEPKSSMDNFNDYNQKTNVSLEWAAMITGVVTVIVSTYLIFGTEWNAYRVTNVVIGVAFLIFITYAFTNSKNLKATLKVTKAKATYLQDELEKSRSAIAEVELEIREKEHEIDKKNSEIASMESKIGGLEEKIEMLQDQVAEANKKKK
ncbi:MAG: hypothetical protein RLZZ599_332 [Bacteroidota bacterium]